MFVRIISRLITYSGSVVMSCFVITALLCCDYCQINTTFIEKSRCCYKVMELCITPSRACAITNQNPFFHSNPYKAGDSFYQEVLKRG